MLIKQTLQNSADGLRSIPDVISIKFKQARSLSLSDYKAGFAKAANKALWTNPLREETTFAKALSFSYLALVFFITLQFQIAYITSVLIAFSAFKILDTAGILLYKVTPGIFDKIKARYDHKSQNQPTLYSLQIIWQLLKEAKSIWNAEVRTGEKKSGHDDPTKKKPVGTPGSNPNGDGHDDPTKKNPVGTPGSNPNGDGHDDPTKKNPVGTPAQDPTRQRAQSDAEEEKQQTTPSLSPTGSSNQTDPAEQKPHHRAESPTPTTTGNSTLNQAGESQPLDGVYPQNTGDNEQSVFGSFREGGGTETAVQTSVAKPFSSAAFANGGDSETESLEEEDQSQLQPFFVGTSEPKENAPDDPSQTAGRGNKGAKPVARRQGKNKRKGLQETRSSEQPETLSADASIVPSGSKDSVQTGSIVFGL